MSVLLLVGIVVAIVAVWAIAAYNRLVQLKGFLDEGWSGIDVQLKRRYDLIPNLVSVVQGYAVHEKGVLEEVTRMRAISQGASTLQDKVAAEVGLGQALKSLFAVAENYPQLKANENFLALQKQLGAIEQDVQLARRYYNGTARNYNISITTFPTKIIANVCSFTKVPYFELAGEHEREVPKVKF